MNQKATAANNTCTISVKMGELAVDINPAELKTLLGSCIGVALYDPFKKVGGLAHVVLPSSRGHQGPAGKFADTAVAELILQMNKLGAKQSSIKAKLIGGANMFSATSTNTIGEQNLQAITEELIKHSIPIVASHCGGNQGRKMTFRLNSGAVIIEIVGSEIVEI